MAAVLFIHPKGPVGFYCKISYFPVDAVLILTVLSFPPSPLAIIQCRKVCVLAPML